MVYGRNGGGPGLLDLWVVDYALGAITTTGVRFQDYDGTRTIASPASADSVIAVGAFTSKLQWKSSNGVTSIATNLGVVGDLAPYSSIGPRRDDVIKPDLCASGGVVVTALSAARRDAISENARIGDVNAEEYQPLAGTSMAAPVVTGAVALMLARPDSGWSSASTPRIKDRLTQTASHDSYTGTGTNERWGAGKVNIEAALRPVRSIHVTAPPRGAVFNTHWPWAAFRTGDAAFDSIDVRLYPLPGCGAYYPIASYTNVAAGTSRSFTYYAPPEFPTQQAYLIATGYYAGVITPRVQSVSDTFVISLSPPPTDVAEEALPLRFALKGNAPNPFNPATTISFETAVNGSVSLRIYSVDGRVVRTLLQQALPKGRYKIPWDGTNEHGYPVASGTYLYQLRSGGKIATRKMVLLK